VRCTWVRGIGSLYT